MLWYAACRLNLISRAKVHCDDKYQNKRMQ